MMIKSKKQMFIVIGVFALILMLTTVTYAFFNYTRTGSSNRISVGRISFTSSQDNTINLSNVFPISSSKLATDTDNHDTVTINITGDTEYSEGIEYKVTLEQVSNTVNNKEVPISFSVTANNLGTKSNDYWNERGSTTNVYNLTETGNVEDGKYILVGYIKPDENGVDGSIDITAYIDAERVGISDTVSRIENNNLIYGETGGDWIDGRTILTTTEWNSISSNPISFKVKVEANEGIWVEEPRIFVMKNLHMANDSNWSNIRGNVTSVEFSTEIPANPITSFDATDITSDGPVTVYTVDDGLGNNTIKVIIIAEDEIYAPENSQGLFRNMTKLVTFDSANFKVDNVTSMHTFFANNGNLENIDTISTWNTSNVQSFRSMFQQNNGLLSINALLEWDTSNVETMYNMFGGCLELKNVDGLINWDTSNVTTVYQMFYNCLKLQNVDGLSNWNTSNVTNMESFFAACTSLSDISALSNWNVSNVTTMASMFQNCTILVDFSALKNWNTSNVTNMNGMLLNCSGLTNIDALANWNVGSVTTMSSMFACAMEEYKTGNPIIDFSPLANWNVSNVTNMSGMFYNVNVLSYQAFKNWNVSNVENFGAMFNATNASPITTLAGLENWDVSSATSMVNMFWDNFNLTDASAINNWNINANIDFTNMFYHIPVHPEFTKVAGTWDSEGTFTPTV